MRWRGWQFCLLIVVIVAGAIIWWQRRDSPKPVVDEPRLKPLHAPNEMVFIPGGSFQMGSNDGPPYERPVHEVTIGAFWIDKTAVTVAQFAKFVEASGYVTDAEKFGWSGVFVPSSREWEKVDGANWKKPHGPKEPAAKENEPVMQVSWNDAVEYAKWAKKRLPTEAEFEYAARGGLKGKTYAWGDELTPGGKYMCNFWQGNWPVADEAKDGFPGVAPVGSFPPNGYGLYDMTGNVWEWCADWYSETYYAQSEKTDPKGPASGAERVLRGGSWMCAKNFCTNYRVAGRMHATADSGLNNLGFRCARDAR